MFCQADEDQGADATNADDVDKAQLALKHRRQQHARAAHAALRCSDRCVCRNVVRSDHITSDIVWSDVIRSDQN